MGHHSHTPERGHGLVTATLIVAAAAIVQSPARVAAYALLLRRQRRTSPELFDGSACIAAITAALDDYQRHC